MRNYVLKLTVAEFLKTTDGKILSDLKKGFLEVIGENMDPEQFFAWKGAIPKLKKAFKGLNDDILVIFEYLLPMANERIDIVLLGNSTNEKPIGLIIELKGWQQLQESLKYQHPEYQVLNYVGKLNLSHSASGIFKFIPCVWLYNMPVGTLSFEKLTNVFWKDQYKEFSTFLKQYVYKKTKDENIAAFLNGYYVQTPKLLEAIRQNFNSLKKGALEALCETGFAPSEEQLQIINEVMESVKNGEKVCYLIEGQPGSGKSYIAILLLLKSLSERFKTVLGYRNNRLLNTLRIVFNEYGERGLDVIKFYSTGRNDGLAEKNPRIYGLFDLVIYDEAQRMRKENIWYGLKRGNVIVVFYDEKQILNPEEEGTKENFKSIAKKMKINIKEKILRGIYRVQGGMMYHKFVETLLSKPNNAFIPKLTNYEFIVFDDIEKMLNRLRLKASESNNKVALVASFTESPGDSHNKKAKNIKNLRIGYPLYSGFDHYKGKNLEIYWLMDEKEQYPKFWQKGESNKLTHCASIYGCQGFEADYVGVIWGRDFVFRNGKWEIGDNCEDNVGKPESLKTLIKKKDEKSLPLLINRYQIFLTRGIKGTYIYCEDEETKKFLLEKQTVFKNSMQNT